MDNQCYSPKRYERRSQLRDSSDVFSSNLPSPTSKQSPGRKKSFSNNQLSPLKLLESPSSPQRDRFIPNRRQVDYSHDHSPKLQQSNERRREEIEEEERRDLRSIILSSSPNSRNTHKKRMKKQGGYHNNEERLLSFSSPSDNNKKKNKKEEEDEMILLSPSLLLSSSSSSNLPSHLQNHNSEMRYLEKRRRNIPTSSSRILDAPDLLDDYYLNLLDWNEHGKVGIGLGSRVYLWNSLSGEVCLLVDVNENENFLSSNNDQPPQNHHVTSISFCNSTITHSSSFDHSSTSPTSSDSMDDVCAVGCDEGSLLIIDTSSGNEIRNLSKCHNQRISSLSWRPISDGISNPNQISSGSRDSFIHHHDLRIPNSVVISCSGHSQEICGLKWNLDGSLLASGGNENLLKIWDMRYNQENHTSQTTNSTSTTISSLFSFDDHIAAVKALAWHPFKRDILSSGGGTADQTIKIWKLNNHPQSSQSTPTLSSSTLRNNSSASSQLLHSVHTKSQVCSLLWSNLSSFKHELISSHGFSDYQLIVWKFSSSSFSIPSLPTTHSNQSSSNSQSTSLPPGIHKIKELRGHTSRVLHLARSPDGKSIASASSDETLRFWDVWNHKMNSSSNNNNTNNSHDDSSSSSSSFDLLSDSNFLSSQIR